MPQTTFYIGSDHAGYKLKEFLRKYLVSEGHDVVDFSPTFKAGDDYPVYAKNVARAIQKHKPALGVLVCGSGHGMEMAADRFRGVRAFVARTSKDAKLAREHNHANVIVFGAWMTGRDEAKRILTAWMKAKPSRAARHVRRVKQLDT